MLKRYGFTDAYAVAHEGTAHITKWLKSLSITRNLTNVEDVSKYQTKDIDLIWETQKATYQVELKVDRYQTGNFFFETRSNTERGTPGCFLYTEADLLFYYFLPVKQLYILPMPGVREWFLNHQRAPGRPGHPLNTFRETDTTTPVYSCAGFYTTRGALVPIEMVLKEVEGVWAKNLLSC
jgi:hypothetical protein